MLGIIAFFILFFCIRLVFLVVSIKNEKRLIALGAKQVGEKNSKLLAAAHIAYYFSALISAYITQAKFNAVSAMGVVIVSLSLLVLYYIVRQLGHIWTVKVYILSDHPINNAWIFRVFKHPNYFLNIIPELIGMALLCQAWYVLAIGLPLYGIVLAIRIKQEQQAMRHLFV